jgi:hypothetical protein
MGARYSRQTGYTISKRTASRPTMRTVKRRISFGPTAAKFMGLAVLAILLLIISGQSGATSGAAYTANGLGQATSKVEQEISDMKLNAERSKSIEEIQKTEVKDQMQVVQQVNYVEKGEVAGVTTEKKN